MLHWKHNEGEINFDVKFLFDMYVQYFLHQNFLNFFTFLISMNFSKKKRENSCENAEKKNIPSENISPPLVEC